MSLAVSVTGEVVVAGSYNGNYPVTNFGPFALYPTVQNSSSIGFVIKYSSSGVIQWVQSFVHTADESISYIRKVQVDQFNNIYVHGSCGSSIFPFVVNFSFGSLQFSSSKFLIKCSTTGQPLTYIPVPDQNSDWYVENMIADENGFVYITGHYFGTITFGAISLTANPGSGMFVAKYDPNGILQWVEDATATGANGYVTNSSISLDGLGNLYVTGRYTGTAQLNGLVLPAATNTSGFIASFDVYTGTANWAQTLTNQFNGSIFITVRANASGQVIVGGVFLVGPLTFGTAPFGAPGPLASNQSFLSRILIDYNTVSGSVFLDANLNGLKDTNEGAHPDGSLVALTPGYYAFAVNGSGNYTAFSDTGTYAVVVPSPALYHTVLPLGPTSVSFSTFGNTSNGHDFALQPIPNQQDLEVFITPLQPFRPGFSNTYRVTYKNVGTTTITSGTVSLLLDSLLSYQSSSILPSSHTDNLVSWAFTNLSPYQTGQIDAEVTLPATTALGAAVSSTAEVGPLAGDLTPVNNTQTDIRTVIGSYDPNSIEVDYEELTPQQVQNEQVLNYTIRFQNLGTDTAFTVMLRDSLPVHLLNLGTLQLVSSSHACTWSVNQAGVMTVLFTNIRLPHESINSIGSNGFVRFRIKPFATLAIGDIIPNKADIYFDYNAPITTNTASTEVVLQLGTAANLPHLNWQVFPNPTKDVVTLQAQVAQAGQVTVKLVNVLGQEVYSKTAPAAAGSYRQELQTAHLPAGIYTLQLHTTDGIAVKQIVKQ